jgi:acetaldehyde dehydrogenase (acetylating)
MGNTLSSTEQPNGPVKEATELAVRAATAQPTLAALSQLDIDRIVESMAATAKRHADELATAAVDETQYGIQADKVRKNLFAAERIYEFIRPMKTVGVVRRHEAKRVVEIAEPFGVVAAIIPSTNPTSTTIYKLLIAMKARCAIVLSPHPSAVRCITKTAELLASAARKAGAPDGAINWMTDVSLEGTQALMSSREVSVILATGGMGLVRAAYSAGKPAYGVGPGNAPAYIERSADIPNAVQDILEGKTFDNGLLCSSENSVVVDAEIAGTVKNEFMTQGGQFLNDEESDRLASALITKQRLPNSEFVGRSAIEIADRVGIDVPTDTRALIVSLDGVGRDYPLSIEKLCPVLSFYEVSDWQEGCERCQQILRYGGMGHTMSIHSRDEDIILEFGLKKPAFRIVVNTPTTLGSIGMTTGLDPSMTLGCGGYGGNITSDNISPRHLLNIKRLAYDTRPTRKSEHTPETETSRLSVTPQAMPPKLDPQLIAERIDSFLASRGLHVSNHKIQETTTSDDLSGTATATTTPTSESGRRPNQEENTEDVVAVEFVAEDDVRRALQQSRQILIDEKTIVTPAARDLAVDHGVFVDLSAGRTR